MLAGLMASQPAFAEAAPFVGPRLETLVGYDATELPDKDGPELMFGIRGGKDFALGKWRIGIDAELSRSNANRVEHDLFKPGDRIHVRYGNDVYLGARAARPLGRHVLGYGDAGGALSSMEAEYSGDLAAIEREPGGPEPEKFMRPGLLIGFWVGGGLEVSLGGRRFLRSEYRYTNFHDGLYRHQGIMSLGIRL
jgi:outer membrane immunogenic protein